MPAEEAISPGNCACPFRP